MSIYTAQALRPEARSRREPSFGLNHAKVASELDSLKWLRPVMERLFLRIHQCGSDEAGKQWVGMVGLGLELRMKLGTEEKWVAR